MPLPNGFNDKQGSSSMELLLLVGGVVGLLVPFVGKAFTVDDTLFLRLAQHIQQNPLDFYGFEINWYGTPEPMYQITQNPPFVGYYIALVAALFGWSEVALHCAFLLPAGAVVVGSYLLARGWCTHPFAAVLLGLVSPVFLVSSTGVMCDTMLMAFWVWSVWLWREGLNDKRWSWLLLSAILAALAAWTKYFGIAIVPLLFMYGLLRQRRLGVWAVPLLIPIVAAVGYDFGTQAIYGRRLFLDAARYSERMRENTSASNVISQLFIGLMFAGGCLASALTCAPLIWGRRVLLTGLVLIVVSAAAALGVGQLPGFDVGSGRWIPAWLLVLQGLLFACGGVSLIALAVMDWWRGRDADSALLTLWVLGTFTFATFMNWVNNGRSNLPMAPVVGVLIVRRMQALGVLDSPLKGLRLFAVLPSFALALAVTYGDFHSSNRVREAVHVIADTHMRPNQNVYFQGHWGFQYYMEEIGARSLNLSRISLEPSEIVVVPSHNTNVSYLQGLSGISMKENIVLPTTWVHTMSSAVGAGFYASNIGPMPFAFGSGPPTWYQIWVASSSIRGRLRE